MRHKAIHVDRYGIDPLKDNVSENLHKITDFQEHLISFPDVGNIDTIADYYYENASLGFILLDYNGIGHEMQLEVGQMLKIPNKQRVLALFASKAKPKAIGITSRVSI